MSRIFLPLLALLYLLAACSQPMAQPEPTISFESPPPSPFPEDPNWTPPPPGPTDPPPEPYDPGKGDESMTRGEVFVDSQEIIVLETYPPQFRLQVQGALPSPCYQLRAVVEEPDEQNNIFVNLFSLVEPDASCAQVLEPFEVSIRLGSFSSGSYDVYLNGEKVAEFAP